jgi:hypothetical protein
MKIVDWVTFRNIYREESFAKFRQTDRQTDRQTEKVIIMMIRIMTIRIMTIGIMMIGII